MKADKFTEAVGGIDETVVAEAIETDSAKKLDALIRKEKMRKARAIIRSVAAVAACICIAFTTAFVLRKPGGDPDNPGNVMVSNPMTYVDSYDEMEKYLGYSVPELKEKTPESYVIFASNGKVESGKVEYTDGSSLKVMRGSGDISGIFGGKLTGDREILSVTVHYYTFEGYAYSVWTDNGYSYCYTTSSGEGNDVYSVTEKIIYLKGETK